MRQLVRITPARLVRHSKPTTSVRTYGPLWGHMNRFLAVKYRLDLDDVRALVTDVFKYIDAETMRNGEYFSVPGFGTFRRKEQGSHADRENAVWLGLDRRLRKYIGTLFTTMEDDEDAGPREDQ